ncbi:MAG: ferric reductase-like transmembrane domain-containing protein [Rikenellaceae bacterium]
MFQTSVELLAFLFKATPFLFSLVILTFLAVKFSKSIKKHSNYYYWGFGILSFLFAFPVFARLCGFEVPFNVSSIPVIGTISRELSSAAYFIHPVLVIIMAMGAFSPKISMIGKLMTIRKELSIIVGFPLIAHLAKRLFSTFPSAWKYFAQYEESITNPKVVSELGSNIQNGVFVLGIVMTVFFLVLWVTSFDGVRRKMGSKNWKKVQKWSYGLYAMLFIHATGLQLGGVINSYATQRIQQETAIHSTHNRGETSTKGGEQHSHGNQQQVKQQGGEQHSHGNQQAAPQQGGQQAQRKGGHSHGPKGFSFSDVELSRAQKGILNIIIYILVYGSYLYFRIKKAKADKARRNR